MWMGKHKKWNPLPQFAEKTFFALQLHDDKDGFRLQFELRDPHLLLTASFDSQLLYMNVDEGDRLLSAEVEGEFPHLFWKVEASELTGRFCQMTSGKFEANSITHFVFISVDDCIDVLALEGPNFSWVQR